jgi:tight adherence protein B
LTRRRPAAHRERVAAVLAATALADDLGAPLAGVLERLADAVAADAEAEAEVRAAVAGPRATARVLTWLPVLGLLVGTALGAQPVATLLHGGLGAVAAVLGAVLLVVGRAWTQALLRRAEAGGRSR